MELKLELSYEQLLSFVHQLPLKQKEKLVKEVQKDLKPINDRDNFRELLLNGPTWTDEQYEEFLEARKHLNEFRTNNVNDID